MATDRIPVGVVGGQGHPLMRVLAGSPTNYEGTIPANIRTFIHTVGGIIGWGALRGIEGLRRYDRVDYTSHMRAWIEMTPLVRRWIHSDRFLRAPRGWPDMVAAEFGWAVPTPYEMSFYLGRNNGRRAGILDAYLYGYCAGLSLAELTAMTGKSVDEILYGMAAHVRRLLTDPRLRLWTWGIDWSGIIIPPDVDESILTRMDLKHTLVRGEMFSCHRDSALSKRMQVLAESERVERAARMAPKLPIRPIPPVWLERGGYIRE